jgi:hypothetical protein
MARVLSIRQTVVPAASRDAGVAQLRLRHRHLGSRDCRHWVFEDAAAPGTFLEFIEAGTADAVSAAEVAAGPSAGEPARLYFEVELS